MLKDGTFVKVSEDYNPTMPNDSFMVITSYVENGITWAVVAHFDGIEFDVPYSELEVC